MHSQDERKQAKREVTLIILGFIGIVAFILGGVSLLILMRS